MDTDCDDGSTEASAAAIAADGVVLTPVEEEKMPYQIGTEVTSTGTVKDRLLASRGERVNIMELLRRHGSFDIKRKIVLML
jgi:hypothetical protein